MDVFVIVNVMLYSVGLWFPWLGLVCSCVCIDYSEGMEICCIYLFISELLCIWSWVCVTDRLVFRLVRSLVPAMLKPYFIYFSIMFCWASRSLEASQIGSHIRKKLFEKCCLTRSTQNDSKVCEFNNIPQKVYVSFSWLVHLHVEE